MELIQKDNLLDEIFVTSALRDRRIYFNEMVTRESVCKIIHILDRLVSLDNKKQTKEDIEIVLDCEGGYCMNGLALISKMLSLQEQGYNINTTVHSLSASMGFMILLVGSNRKSLRYSEIMCHQPSSSTWGMLQDMEEEVEQTQKTWNIMKDLIINHTKITDEQLEDIKRRKFDWWMSPKEALSLGVIDEII